jgi:hypothetical protein
LKFINLNKKSSNFSIKNKRNTRFNNNKFFYINFFFFLTSQSIFNVHKKFLIYLSDFLYYNRNLINYSKDSFLTKNLLLSSSIIPFIIKNGNTFTNSVQFFNLFTKFYTMSFSDILVEKFNSYKYYKEFFYNFKRYNNYKNLNFLLSWVFSWMQPMFHIECSTVPKKYRKKLKKKYLYKIKYLNKNKRLNKAINWVVKYANTLKNYKFSDRHLLVYLDLLLNYKNSYLYNKKLLVYKKIFKL